MAVFFYYIYSSKHDTLHIHEELTLLQRRTWTLGFHYYLTITIPLPTAPVETVYVLTNTTISTMIARPARDSNPELVPTPDREANTGPIRHQSLSSKAQLLGYNSERAWRYQ